MNRIFSTLGISLWIALLSPMVQAANLKTLDVAALPGDRVELKLSFDGPPPTPHGYTTESAGTDCAGSARRGQSTGEQES